MLKNIKTALIIAVFLGALGQAAGEEKEKKFYDPVPRKLEGWTIKVDPKLLKKEHKDFKKEVFKSLANHLQRIKYILPEERVVELQNSRSGSTTITNHSAPCSTIRVQRGCAPIGMIRDS